MLWSLFLLLQFIEIIIASKIAVCVGGQLARWLPEHIVNGLILSNPQYTFNTFVNIQFRTQRHPIVYNTDSHLTFHPSNLTELAQGKILEYISDLYFHPNSNLVSITYTTADKKEDWENDSILHGNIDRIVQYKATQSSILNMYLHQENCLNQIRNFERRKNFTFDYVLGTREDIFYFSPVNLTFLLENMQKEGCVIATKECLTWGGINMRWQLFTRNATDYFYGKRFEYYRYLQDNNIVVYNPEQFEHRQAQFYQLKICQYFSHQIPNAVARHVKDGQFCFFKAEIIDNCVPSVNNTFVNDHHCNKVPHTLKGHLE